MGIGQLTVCSFAFLLIFQTIEVVVSSPTESKLIHYLLDDYEEFIRPVAKDEDSVNVTFNFAIFQLIEINEKSQHIEVVAWIRKESAWEPWQFAFLNGFRSTNVIIFFQKWHDSKLRWNPSDYNNITEFNIRPDKIWVPDIVLYNNIQDDNAEFGGNMDTLKTRLIVYHTGMVYWLAPIIIKASCRMNVQDFPFDTQHCKFKFGSWSYDAARLDIHTEGIDTADFPQNLEWNLIKAEGIRNEVVYNCCPDRIYPDVTFHVYFQRRSLFYVLNLIFPIALITLLTIVVFILPAESGERLSLAVTLMLATTVFMLLVAETTPDSSEGVPVVVKYFIVCMVMMFVIIVLLCYMSRWYNRKSTDRPMGEWTRRYILNRLSYIVWIRHKPEPKDAVKLLKKVGINESGVRVVTSETRFLGGEGNSFTNGVVRGSTYNSKSTYDGDNRGENGNVPRKDDGEDYFDDCFIDGDKYAESPRLSLLKRLSKCSHMSKQDARSLELVIREIERKERMQLCGDIDDNDGDNDDNSTFEEEWRIVAMTVDRCLFILFVTCFIIGSIACFANHSFVN